MDSPTATPTATPNPIPAPPDPKPLVYVAGPLTTGNMALNTNRAIKVWASMVRSGLITPFCPHFTTLGDLILGESLGYEDYMRYDFEIIRHCDAVYRLSGASSGADREVTLAASLDIPVFFESTVEGVSSGLMEWAYGFCVANGMKVSERLRYAATGTMPSVRRQSARVEMAQ